VAILDRVEIQVRVVLLVIQDRQVTLVQLVQLAKNPDLVVTPVHWDQLEILDRVAILDRVEIPVQLVRLVLMCLLRLVH
jgi:hypothetical protein